MGSNVSALAPNNLVNGNDQTTKPWEMDGCEQLQDTPIHVGSQTIDDNDFELPRGAIMLWYGTERNIPQGWVPCDGREIVYYNYEANNVLVTYKIPDMRGRMAINLEEPGQKCGDKLGVEFITMPDHKHKHRYKGSVAEKYGNSKITTTAKNHIGPPFTTSIIISETSKSETSSTSRTISQIPTCAVLFYIFRAY